MTRLFVYYLCAVLAPSVVSSFCPLTTATSSTRFRAPSSSKAASAQERLDQIMDSWNEMLQEKVTEKAKEKSEGAPKDTAKEVLEKGLELVLARKAVATERIASKTEALVEIEARLREVSNEFKEAKKDEAGAKQALKILERNEQELLAALEQLNS